MDDPKLKTTADGTAVTIDTSYVAHRDPFPLDFSGTKPEDAHVTNVLCALAFQSDLSFWPIAVFLPAPNGDVSP